MKKRFLVISNYVIADLKTLIGRLIKRTLFRLVNLKWLRNRNHLASKIRIKKIHVRVYVFVETEVRQILFKIFEYYLDEFKLENKTNILTLVIFISDRFKYLTDFLTRVGEGGGVKW